MIIELTRTSGENVCINVAQICWFYELGNGQTYFVLNAERSNLTVEENYALVKRLIQMSMEIHGISNHKKEDENIAHEVRSKLANKSIPG